MAAHGRRVGGIASDMRLSEELEGLLQQPFPGASLGAARSRGRVGSDDVPPSKIILISRCWPYLAKG